MKFLSYLAVTLSALVLCGPVSAQGFPEMPEATAEHQWLKQFVGQWQTSAKAEMGPDQEPMACEGIITSRMLGDWWVVNEMKGEPMGMPVTGLQTIGYDTEKKKYIGTWVDSTNSHMWRYEGTRDESGKKLVLEAEGPDMSTPGKMTQYRDAYEFRSADEILITSSMLGPDGQWVTFMEGKATRIP